MLSYVDVMSFFYHLQHSKHAHTNTTMADAQQWEKVEKSERIKSDDECIEIRIINEYD